MEIRLLGALEVLDDGGDLVGVSGAKLRSLLAALAIRPGQVVSSDRLIEELWGEEAPSTAPNSLQALVSKLRRALPDQVVVTRAPGYVLEVDTQHVDVGRFAELAAAGRAALAAGDPTAGSTLLAEALALWRGEALAEFAYEDFARAEIVRLTEERASVLEDRMEADLACARHAELVAELEEAVAAEPLRERRRSQLMIALYRSGRQADALRQFQEARRVLGDELGLEPGPELSRLEASMLAHDPALELDQRAIPRVAAATRRSSLPTPLTTTIGREQDLVALESLVDSHRLVTVVGPGGVGKTRLAVETARAVEGTFADGAYLVELAPLLKPDHVAQGMAASFGLPDLPGTVSESDQAVGRLVDFLESLNSLVVLDNCEHVIDESARITGVLLSRCPGLRILATSREPLGVPGEHVWQARPLELADAVSLFSERASGASSEFLLDDQSRVSVADICERLDGLPLAIELAAARVRAFPLGQIAARLGQRFKLLTTGSRTAEARQQTLRAVVDWSYELLFEDERRLFERLSVFAGGCELGAAEEVCSDELLPADEVPDVLARLVDKSLIVIDQRGGRPRLSMLQTLVEYGLERLTSRGELEEMRRRHARWYADLTAESYSAMLNGGERWWLRAVDQELNNMRLAFEWSVAGEDAEVALTIAGGLGWFWWLRGNPDEGLRWTEGALACPGSASSAFRARTLTWAAFLSMIAGRPLDPRLPDEAIAMYEETDDAYGLGVASLQLVQVYLRLGQLERARAMASKARQLFESLQDEYPWFRPGIVWCDGFVSLVDGDTNGAERAMRQYVAHPDNCTDFTKSITFIYLADMSEGRGDYQSASSDLERAQALGDEIGMRGQKITVLVRRANLAALSGDQARARSLYESAVEAAREIGYTASLALMLNVIAARQASFDHLEAAAAQAEWAFELHRETGSHAGCAQSLLTLGLVAERQADRPAAEARFSAAFDEACVVDDGARCRRALVGLALSALDGRDAQRAAHLLGAARRFLNTDPASDPFGPMAGDWFVLVRWGEEAEERMRLIESGVLADLSESEFERALAEGAAMNPVDLLPRKSA